MAKKKYAITKKNEETPKVGISAIFKALKLTKEKSNVNKTCTQKYSKVVLLVIKKPPQNWNKN